MIQGKQLVARSHVGRDILQTAQLFKTIESAVWEYVANSLEYVDAGVQPEVQVQVDVSQGRIRISDNARGMDGEGLQDFFTMHGENVDRRRGRKGRGKFGTGKSAAFGIGKRLEVATVRGGTRHVVDLTRSAIEASGGDAVPVNVLVDSQPTDSPNGTVITIEDLFAKRIAIEPVIRLIERHLGYWRAIDPIVMVGAHRCLAWKPTIVRSRDFQPLAEQAKLIGGVTLTVHIAQSPLDEGLRGVAITAGPGNLVAIETAGVDGKEFGNFLLGEVDVPNLDELTDEQAAYDMSRSLVLNASHPIAGTLIGFIGFALDQVRAELVAEHRARRKEQQFKELDETAKKISQLLNRDLVEVARRFADLTAMRRREGRVARAGSEGADNEPGAWVEGGSQPGILDPIDSPGTAEAERQGRSKPDLARGGQPDDAGAETVQPAGGEGQRRRPRGGLNVRYDNLGEDYDRSLYEQASKEIVINLDHPTAKAAIGVGGVEDIAFQRLSHEIAFTQYALAVAQEMLVRDPHLTADDTLYEVRDTLRRVTRLGAQLYA